MSGDREVQRTMLELLNQLDGFSSDDSIKVSAYFYFKVEICALNVPNLRENFISLDQYMHGLMNLTFNRFIYLNHLVVHETIIN